MGLQMRFDDFTSRFTSLEHKVRADSYRGSAFEAAPELVPGFVPPELETDDWDQSSRVVLVEAAGAVGKSATAAALADRLNWPLIHAERAQVGSYSLSGLLSDALGFDASFMQMVARGEAGIVIDALDEAHLRAGTANFLSFLKNISQLAAAPGYSDRPPTIVLFSRVDTAEIIRYFMEDEGLRIANVRIKFFARDSAFAFIENFLASRWRDTGRPEYHIAMAQPIPFRKLRDLRLRQLARVVTGNENADLLADWDEAQDFLGYAPVLIAVAESLAVANPQRERSDIEQGAAADEWALIEQVVVRILLREQEKFVQGMRDKLHAHLGPHDNELPNDLYSPLEQVIRLIAYVTEAELRVPPPVMLPEDVRNLYETSAAQFTADHPFVRGRSFASPVFSDYAQASASIRLEAKAGLSAPPDLRVDQLGPFFVGFLLRHLGEGSPPSIEEDLVEPTLHSWHEMSQLKGRGAQDAATLILEEEGGWLDLPGVGIGGPDQDASALISVTNLSGAATFERLPRRTTVFTSQGLVVGTRDQVLSVPPRSVIIAGELSLQCEILSLMEIGHGSGAFWFVDKVEANYLKTVDFTESSHLQVHGRDLPAKLLPFRAVAGSPTTAFAHLTDGDVIHLRALLILFRSTVHLGLSAPVESVERFVQRGDGLRRAMVDELMHLGVITRSGDWFLLDSSALRGAGFTLSDIRRAHPTAQMSDFLMRCRGRMK